MQIKIKDLILFSNLYETLKNRTTSIKTAYKLNKLAEATEKEQGFIQSQQTSIINKFGQKDGNGNFKYLENGDIQIQPERIQDCKKAMQELMDFEIDMPDINFTFEELEPLNLSINDLKPLMKFICEN